MAENKENNINKNRAFSVLPIAIALFMIVAAIMAFVELNNIVW